MIAEIVLYFSPLAYLKAFGAMYILCGYFFSQPL